MVVCMLVNNILGTVQDVAGIVRSVREAEKRFGRKIHVHCDCVQAIGKTVFSLPQLGVDSASFSAIRSGGLEAWVSYIQPLHPYVRFPGEEIKKQD